AQALLQPATTQRDRRKRRPTAPSTTSAALDTTIVETPNPEPKAPVRVGASDSWAELALSVLPERPPTAVAPTAPRAGSMFTGPTQANGIDAFIAAEQLAPASTTAGAADPIALGPAGDATPPTLSNTTLSVAVPRVTPDTKPSNEIQESVSSFRARIHTWFAVRIGQNRRREVADGRGADVPTASDDGREDDGGKPLPDPKGSPHGTTGPDTTAEDGVPRSLRAKIRTWLASQNSRLRADAMSSGTGRNVAGARPNVHPPDDER